MVRLFVSAILVAYAANPVTVVAPSRAAEVAGSPGELAAPGPAELVAAPSLDALFATVLPAPTGDYGLVVEDLGSGRRVGLNEDSVFPSASLYKLGVAWVVLRRVDASLLSLEEPVLIEDADAAEVEPLGGVAPGETPTLRETLAAMLSVSSNAAAHALLRLVGRAEFNQEMQRLGLTQTRVPQDTLPQVSLEQATLQEEGAVTSAADIAQLLRLVATSPQLSAVSRTELTGWLANNEPPDALRDALPDTVGIVDKTGNLDDASNVAALLSSPRGTVLLVVLDHGVEPGDARAVIAQLGQVAYAALLGPAD